MYNNSKKKKDKKIIKDKDIVNFRLNFIVVCMFVIFSVIILTLFNIQIINNNKYMELANNYTETIIEGTSAPRGIIYDRNYNVIVDNVAIQTIYYSKSKSITTAEEIALAYRVAEIIDLDYSSLYITNLKEFWMANNPVDAYNLITSEEYEQLELRKLTESNIYSMKIERITTDMLEEYSNEDKEAAYLYYLMNKGYSYDEKVIKNVGVTDEEYAIISENINNLQGFYTALDWERYYPYGDTFKTILGRVSTESQGLPSEFKDYYLELGYALNDRVGVSYIEYIYEDLLKGTKATYKVLNDNSLELVEEGSRGNDIVLSIDIKLQVEIDKIVTEELTNAQNEPNTDYYDKSFVVISDPNTGEILAMSGKQIINGEVYDYTQGNFVAPVIVGSVIKAASLATGYKYGAIDIGTVLYDQCIKIASTPIKCSYMDNLGNISDTQAMIYSSNSYQFQTAIKVGNGVYRYDQPLSIDVSAFEKYRSMYAEYGLGVSTGIGFSNESLGYKGTSTLPGHLLDFSMGQYDTYTPLQLISYVNTIATRGDRYSLSLFKESYDSTTTSLTNLISKEEPVLLNQVSLEEKYNEHLATTMYEVLQGPLGYGYMGNVPSPAGKTGTSQSFYDSDFDGVIDKETITTTFAGFYPYDDPIMSVVCVSPDVSHVYGINYQTMVNKRICSKVSNKFYEFYK